jgi:hypothetical protein
MRFLLSQYVVANMEGRWVGVMACAVKMLDADGIWSGKPELGRLEKP